MKFCCDKPTSFEEALNYTKHEKSTICMYVCYLFAIKTLIKYNADGPDVDFGGDFWRLFTNDKTFRRQIPAINTVIKYTSLSLAA